jgi:hypothetical protein
MPTRNGNSASQTLRSDIKEPDARIREAVLRSANGDKAVIRSIGKFAEVLEYYQSNRRNRDKSRIVEAFKRLPLAVQDYISEPAEKIKELYRGFDNNPDRQKVASFTDNYQAALNFGSKVVRSKDLNGFDGIINTQKFMKLLDTQGKTGGSLADLVAPEHRLRRDEGEYIVYGGVYKKNIGNKEWMEENSRFMTENYGVKKPPVE